MRMELGELFPMVNDSRACDYCAWVGVVWRNSFFVKNRVNREFGPSDRVLMRVKSARKNRKFL